MFRSQRMLIFWTEVSIIDVDSRHNINTQERYVYDSLSVARELCTIEASITDVSCGMEIPEVGNS